MVAEKNNATFFVITLPLFYVLGSKPPGGGGTPIHYLYGYVLLNGVVILKLLI